MSGSANRLVYLGSNGASRPHYGDSPGKDSRRRAHGLVPSNLDAQQRGGGDTPGRLRRRFWNQRQARGHSLPGGYLSNETKLGYTHDPLVADPLVVSLNQRDRDLFMTDGLPEALTPSGDPLGYEALEELIQSSSLEQPLTSIDNLFQSVRSRTSEVADDDWTALVLDVLP